MTSIVSVAYLVKYPDWGNSDLRRRMGDSISSLDHSPTVRASVHSEKERDHDLGGYNVLISDHFYYFGDRLFLLPPELLG